MSHNGSLSARQRIALDALLVQPIVTKAAESTGIPRRILTRWLSDDTFKRELERRRSELSSEQYSRISNLLGKTVDKLSALLDSADERISLSACRTVLDAITRFSEYQRLADRVCALEDSGDTYGEDEDYE